MPSISHNAQSFVINNRHPFWVLAAGLPYARVPEWDWADRLAAVRQAGFTAVQIACPWIVHEPRPGRFDFTGRADVKRFCELAGEADLMVVVRLGPFVGDLWDGGGLPAWLQEQDDIALREANPAFHGRVSTYLRKLCAQIKDLQFTDDGPVVLAQIEHAWTCNNDEVATKYLNELVRIVRECGIDVPLINSNDLWQDVPGTISTWRGRDHLLSHLRQLRCLQPDVPPIVSALDVVTPEIADHADDTTNTPSDVLRHLAEVLAAGAQPIVEHFHAGLHIGFDGGRPPGEPDSMALAIPAMSPLGEAGQRTETYRLIRRLMTFASSFEHVFSHLEPDYQPIVLDPTAEDGPQGLSVVPIRSPLGRAAFIFGGKKGATARLLANDGITIPVHLGDQGVAWTLFDVDLNGAGRLDYTNLCPFTMVGRSILVLHGPERSQAYVSIDGVPLEAKIPSGKKPVVVDHHGLTVVICSQNQIDVTYHDGERVWVGIDGFDGTGEPIAAEGYPRAMIIEPDASTSTVAMTGPSASTRGKSLTGWHVASGRPQAIGDSPRYATLDGPASLSACGAQQGYGWYRMRMKLSSARKRLCHLPEAADRVHLFLDGDLLGIYGDGPGAATGPFELKLPKGEFTLTALVENAGRFWGGDDILNRKGLFGHLFEIKPLKSIKPKIAEFEVIDPFALKGFIDGLARGQVSEPEQVSWTFTHAKKSPLVVEVGRTDISGTFVLNDVPIRYLSRSGHRRACFLLQPSSDEFKRGKNVLRFAPDPGQEKAAAFIAKNTTLAECVECVTKTPACSWSFAKWEPPKPAAFEPVGKSTSAFKGTPCWWRADLPAAKDDRSLWLDMTGLSKGMVLLNGQHLARYFVATSTGKAVESQTRVLLPAAWMHEDEPNELMIFDEHGCSPTKTKVFVAG